MPPSLLTRHLGESFLRSQVWRMATINRRRTTLESLLRWKIEGMRRRIKKEMTTRRRRRLMQRWTSPNVPEGPSKESDSVTKSDAKEKEHQERADKERRIKTLPWKTGQGARGTGFWRWRKLSRPLTWKRLQQFAGANCKRRLDSLGSLAASLPALDATEDDLDLQQRQRSLQRRWFRGNATAAYYFSYADDQAKVVH